jgi:hypothetical protein
LEAEEVAVRGNGYSPMRLREGVRWVSTFYTPNTAHRI